jgi:hypothetical protein
MSGGGTSLVTSFEELEVCLMRSREDVALNAEGRTGLVGMKVIKNGVASPLNGNVILSVVFPRNICSAVGGGAGVGAKSAFVKGSFCRFWTMLVDLLEAVELGKLSVSFAGTVPFRNLISILKLG